MVSLLARQSRGGATPVLTMGLVVLAFLVVSVKYIAPMLYYIAERLAQHPIGDVAVMWDFWWPVYLLVAAQLYYRARRAWVLFLIMATLRILWSAVVLTLFFAKPSWDFWNLQWLFYEIITLAIMACGMAIALSAAARDQMEMQARPVSLTA